MITEILSAKLINDPFAELWESLKNGGQISCRLWQLSKIGGAG